MVSHVKEQLNSNIDSLVRELERHAVAGCCARSLEALEAQVEALPWPADADAARARERLIDAIRKLQERARKASEPAAGDRLSAPESRRD